MKIETQNGYVQIIRADSLNYTVKSYKPDGKKLPGATSYFGSLENALHHILGDGLTVDAQTDARAVIEQIRLSEARIIEAVTALGLEKTEAQFLMTTEEKVNYVV